jgi:hypothetical protein
MLLENFCQLWTRNLLSLKKFGRNLGFAFRLTGTLGTGGDGERQWVAGFCIAAGQTPESFFVDYCWPRSPIDTASAFSQDR